MKNQLLGILLFFCVIISCKNRDINEGEEFRPRSIHENFEEFEFDTVTVDGIDYWIMERDNNNPHEGFGFMAVRANPLFDKQDSILAHLKALGEMQSLIYARLYKVSVLESDSIYNESVRYYLNQGASNQP